MTTLDLSLSERPTMTVILPRRKRYFLSRKQRLDVLTPSKSTRELFTFLGGSLINLGENKATEEDFERIYDVTARILSRNKQCIEITKEDLESRLDIVDITKILGNYADFLTRTIESKN